MTFLITGGAGFIGSHLTAALLKRGDRVISVDNLSTGSMDNIRPFADDGRFTFIKRDLVEADQGEINEMIAESDAVCHLAAAVGVELVVSSPVHTILTNVRATEKILTGCAERGKRLIAASTSEVYGKSRNESFAETDDLLIGPSTHSRWGYACSKLLDEFYLMAYCREYGLPGTVVRFFNTVGPRQTGRYGMVIPRLVKAALAGEDLPVYGDGNQSRCFCHVSDTVRAVLALFDHPEASGNIYNIGSTDLVTINELAERIIRLTGSASGIVHIPYEKAYKPGFEDMRRRKPSIAKIGELTGWAPEIGLDRIIIDVAEEIRRHGDR